MKNPKRKVGLSHVVVVVLGVFLVSFVYLGIFNNAKADITTGLVGHWKFEEGSGTVSLDASGNGNDGILTNGPTWLNGVGKNGVLSFDGVDDYVELNSSLIGTEDATFCSWVYARSGAPNRNASFIGNSRFFMGMDTYEDPGLKVYFTNNTDALGSSGGHFGAQAWHLLCMTRSGSVGNLYLNGQQFGPTNQSIGTPATVGAPLILGNQFFGYMDEVRLYSRAFSASDIQQLYNATYLSYDITPPVISSIATSTTALTATITFNTNEIASSTINYGLTSSYGMTSSSNDLTTSTTFILTGLESSTTYHFRVTATDASNNSVTTSDMSFSTGNFAQSTHCADAESIALKSCSSDGSAVDTQNALNYITSRNEDGWVLTIGVPGGSYVWTGLDTVSIAGNNTITVQGASPTNRPTISMGTALGLNYAIGKVITVKDIIFTKGDRCGTTFFVNGEGPNPGFRFTNIKWVGTWCGVMMSVGSYNNTTEGEGPYGLIDNSEGHGVPSFFMYANTFAGEALSSGWKRPMEFGTTKASIVFEDNYFHTDGPYVQGTPLTDTWAGGSFVLRHNVLENQFIANHGADHFSNHQASAVKEEIMHNTFKGSGGGFVPWFVFLRGGSAVIFDNTFEVSGGTSATYGIAHSYFRASNWQGPSNSLFDRWYNPISTTITSASNGQSLPQDTINVASTFGLDSGDAYAGVATDYPGPATYIGNIKITTSNGVQTIECRTKTATSFSGCTGGSGVMSTGGAVTRPSDYGMTSTQQPGTGTIFARVASGSNGAVLPQSTINVESTIEFPSNPGIIAVNVHPTTGVAATDITCTGKTSTTFTGCTGGTGTLATGQLIADKGQDPRWPDNYWGRYPIWSWNNRVLTSGIGDVSHLFGSSNLYGFVEPERDIYLRDTETVQPTNTGTWIDEYQELQYPHPLRLNDVNSGQYYLTVTKSGTGSGTVTSSPSGISCGSTCSDVFDDGTTVTLTASPSSGSTFAGWSGGGCSGTGTCVVSSGSSVTATFNTTSDTTAPTLSSITATNVSSGGATITWTTNESATSRVEYGPTTSYGSQTTLSSSLVTSHSVALSGLSAGTTYHYRVISTDGAGNTTTSSDQTFTTSAASSGSSSSGSSSSGSSSSSSRSSGGSSSSKTTATVSTTTVATAPAGCLPGYLFNIHTGKPCTAPVVTPQAGCLPGYLFNIFTGTQCTTTLPPGCLPGYLFSIQTGQRCTPGAPLPATVVTTVTTATPSPAPVSTPVPAPVFTPSTPVPTPPPSPTLFTRDLTLGSVGEDVRALQVYLNSRGYVVAIVGPGSRGNETDVFGVSTLEALARFQVAKRIFPAAGYFGGVTRSLITK